MVADNEINNYQISSEIQNFYNGKTIFVTGASGFIGKLLVEKLLRSCKGLNRIYILLREKKSKLPIDRFNEIYDIPAFDILKLDQPDFLSRVSILEGDLILPDLGLSETHLTVIRDKVDCIFHVGASVRFDEKLKRAAYMNVRSLKDLLRIAGEMKQLKSFVYVSTAYSNCTRKDIEETFYEPLITAENLLELIELPNDKLLDAITPGLIQDNPNTYTFTKSLAENLIKVESKNLPVVIVRPSIVLSTYKEPFPGWIDNLYGPTSVLLAAWLGLLRSVHANISYMADLVPADFVVNTILVAAWDVANNDNDLVASEYVEKQVKIFNCVNGPQTKITWGEYTNLAREYTAKNPTQLLVWYPTMSIFENYYLHRFVAFLLQTVPASIIDFLARCVGKEPICVKTFKKIDKLCYVTSFFTTNEWNFSNANTQTLYKKLNSTDKTMFNFDMASLSWRDFFETYLVGARTYLLNDPLHTIPRGKRKYLAVKIGHYLIVTGLCLVCYKLMAILYGWWF